MLKYQLDSLDGIDEGLRSFYEQGENGFKLKVDGLEDTSGLKSALEKERQEKKEAKSKLSELEKLRDEAEKKALEEQGKYKELTEKERNERLQVQKDLNDLKNRIATAKRDAMVKDFALSMTTDKDEIDIISRFATDYINIEGEEVSFNKPIDAVKSELSRFVRSKASGTNDGGNNNGGGNAKTMARDAFEKLSAGEKADFFKNGGKLI